MGTETFYEVIRRQGISRRSFLKFVSLTAASLGLPPAMVPHIVRAFEEKPRIPVLWLHGLECTCCSESFIRSGHPLASDVLLSMISLDYDDTIMAAAGHQAEKCLDDIRAEYAGRYIVAVEGNAPLADQGVYCMVGGRPFVEQLREVCADASAVIAWGSCASWGCVQAARPNPTRATPVHELITDKPVIKVPGCPPIAEVMTGVLSYIVAFDRLPELDRRGRPTMFYGNRIHDRCYRRSHFDAGQFVEKWDDDAARSGHCLYKVGCRGPTTYSPCATTRWNGGISFPIQSGHGCIGCTEEGFWDDGPFYEHLASVGAFGIDHNADVVGSYVAAGVGAGVAVHAAVSAVKRSRQKKAEREQKAEREKKGRVAEADAASSEPKAADDGETTEPPEAAHEEADREEADREEGAHEEAAQEETDREQSDDGVGEDAADDREGEGDDSPEDDESGAEDGPDDDEEERQ